jgi:putative DNA primase/helicase
MDAAADIKRLCETRAEAEREQYEQSEENSPNSKAILDELAASEDGDARLFSMLHEDGFCYDHSAKDWFAWAGHYWREDTCNEAMRGIDAVIDSYGVEASRQAWAAVTAAKAGKSEEAEKHRKLQGDLLKRILALQTAQRKRSVMFLATVGKGLTGNEWDRDPWLLGCINGVIDLRTGEQRLGRQVDSIKPVAPTAWNGIDAPCPTWDRFISEILDGDVELISYIQRLLGYGITGLTILHIIVFLWGAGRNGKGTLLETLKHVLGEIAYKAESELLLEQKFARQSGAPNSGILSLRGKRLVYCSETDEGRKMATSRVKELVGGDTLNARPLYSRRHVEFAPSHLLMLLTNHRPNCPAGDYALWQRIHLIPFTLSFVDRPEKENERKADTELPHKLKSEGSGILAWLVRGCLELPAARVESAEGGQGRNE